MGRRTALRVLVIALMVLAPRVARAQTTTEFHLHDETSGDSCCRALKTTGPDIAASVVLQSADLKNHGTEHGRVGWFLTLPAVPNWYGAIAAGSTIRFRLWMDKTANWGVVYPEATLSVNNGPQFCTATGVASAVPPNSPTNQALTTTRTEYVFSCTTATAVTVTTTDRLFLAASYYLATGPGNHTMKVELAYEGSAASPVTDSRVIVPNPVAPTPTITGFNYTSAPPSTVVRITGTKFGVAGVTRSVTFNGTGAATANWTATTVDATVPAGLAPGPSPALVPVPVTVIVQSIQSAASTFSINPPPTLTSLTPSTAHTTDVVTITGQNFLATQAQGSSTVTFNNLPGSPTTWNDTTIQVPVPSGQTAGTVIVTVAGRSTTSGLPFTLIPAPTVTALYPTSGQVGAPVTIVGQRFGATQGTNTIKFNGTTASPTQWSDTLIKAPVPAGATTGPLVVKVSNQASPNITFTVLVAGGMSGAITRVTGGTPISGASVQAVLAGVVKGTATTAGDGSYAIPGLDPGTYDVRVFQSGFSPELRTGNVVTSSNTTTVNVTMYLPGSATGKVTQIDGITPLLGAAVTVYDGPIQKGTTNTNATGDYTVSNLHPGSLTVQAANVGYRTAEQTAAIAESAATTTNFSLAGAPSGPVLYAYDELGRLVQVTDPSGASAIYRYDAVGNIVAIERPGAGTVAISEFTPNSGPVGTPVTVDGSGFSTTPASNQVTFGGTPATVTAATASQLTVTASAGGQIAVSAPGGSGNSGTNLFLVTASGPPTITSFTPGTATSGTALTINGTNFDLTTTNNNLTLNVSPAQIGSATVTAIQSTVPASATTGYVSVATPNGTVTTSNYLWVAPPPYGIADLDATTGTLAFGTATAVSAAAGKVALRVFDGIAGHRASIKVTGVTASTSVYLYDPIGNVMQSALTILTDGFVEVATLRSTATYSVVFGSPNGADSGTLTVYDVPADFRATITPGGPSVTVPIATPGQNGVLTFAGTALQRISLKGTNGTIINQVLGCDVYVTILNPDGSVLDAATCMEGDGFIDATRLPTTGTYTILVDPASFAIGSLPLTLYSVTDVTGTITPGGSPVVVPIGTPGQNGALTFAGSANQQISLDGTGTIFGQIIGCDVNVSIVRTRDNLVIASPTCMEGSGSIGATTLPPTADDYTIVIDPVSTATGNLTLTLHNLSPDPNVTLTIDDLPAALSVRPPPELIQRPSHVPLARGRS